MSTSLCRIAAVGSCLLLLAQLAACTSQGRGDGLSVGPQFPRLTYGCGFDPRTDHLILRLPLPDGAGRRPLNASGRGDLPKTKSLNVSLCSAELTMAVQRREQAASWKHTAPLYTLDLNWGGPNATTVWLFWSFSGLGGDCISNAKTRYPGLIVLSEGGDDLKRSKVTVFFENSSAGSQFSVTIGGEMFDDSQFTGGPEWFQLIRPSLDLGTSKTVTVQLGPDKKPYSLEFGSGGVRRISEFQVDSCLGPGETKIPRTKTSWGDAADGQTVWLIVCLCGTMTIVSIIGITIFVIGGHRPPDGLPPQDQLRVALAGCSEVLRRRLARDASATNRPVSFDVADIANLRDRANQFDLVLLFLGPGDAANLTQEQNLMVALERWRFRLLMLATTSPESAAAGEGEANTQQLLLDGEQKCKGVGVCCGGGGDCLEEMFTLARDACREAEAARRRRGARADC